MNIDSLGELKTLAENGDAEAMFNLGEAYALGQDMAEDFIQAANWYALAAKKNHAPAQTALGRLYQMGQGVAEDQGRARDLFLKAAETGYAPAQTALGLWYDTCEPGENSKEAFGWFQKAALQGEAMAQFMLGLEYQYGGSACKVNPVIAHMWFSFAYLNTPKDDMEMRVNAQESLDELEEEMSLEQLDHAKILRNEWALNFPQTLNKPVGAAG